MDTHYRIRADRRRDRDEIRATLQLPPILAVVDAHRRLRGPFTAAGALLRSIGKQALHQVPELGPRHHIEILTVAPELKGLVPPIKATLELTGATGVRTRYQARVHTLRIAHGLVEFLRDYLVALDDGPRTFVVENAHEADPTDHEFLAVLLTRLPATQLTVVVGTGRSPIVEPPGPASLPLGPALAEHATCVDGPPAAPTATDIAESDVVELARAYVNSDCSSDDPHHHAAYDRLPATARAALHDERAAELTAMGEPSLLLGAVPYHAENGSDPAGAGATAIRSAQLHCKGLGLYHAAADLGIRGRRLVDRASRPELWWDLTGDMTTSLAAVGRADEAEAFYDEARALTTDPELHMHLAYGTAMLYARHYPEDRRNPKRARAWLNLAVAISSRLEDPKKRAFYSVFNRNGTALVDVREGRFDDALRVLNEGMEQLDRELEPDEYLLHRTGLRYNRAQIYMMNGRLEEALADFTYVIELDPNFHDHYFNRGNVLGRLGRHAEAIADYERALELSPPFIEAYYNRGDARLELGDTDGALADFSHALEMDPAHVHARLNRAAILCDLDEHEAAWSDVTAGLAIDPGNADLWCVKGRLLAERGETLLAREALSTALQFGDSLAEAYAIRGGIAFEAKDLAGAISDLDRAVELLGTPEMRFNRAIAYEAAERFTDAAADFDRVFELTDDSDARQRRDACLAAATDYAAA